MKNQGIIGAVLLAAGGFCPLLHLPVIGNWNYFDIDPILATVFYVLVVLSLIGSFLGRSGLVRFSGWAALALVLVTLAGVYLKSHDYFSFIHFKKLVNFAAGIVKYKWGWFVILAGALVLITVRGKKTVLTATSTTHI
jgi:hypothetical protein